ncbi:hypothetical protein Tco_0028019, partial [Tanacetum coccineum]
VMSSASSAVTYTSIYTDFEPGRVFWGADEEISDGGPEEPQTPPVPQDEDEREPMIIQPHDPDYVPEPIYPEYIPLEDEHSDLKEDLEEYKDDETEDGPVDYLIDGGEDEDDDGNSSGDDAGDDDKDEEDEEEVEEHLALADSAVVVPTVELVSQPEGTEHVIPPPSTYITTTGWDHLARCTTPSVHSSPPPVPSLLLPSSECPTQIQTLRIASTQALIDVVTIPPLQPSLYIPPPVDRRNHIPKSEQPPHKRSCLFALGSRCEVEESSTARPTGGQGVDYGFVSTLDAEER